MVNTFYFEIVQSCEHLHKRISCNAKMKCKLVFNFFFFCFYFSEGSINAHLRKFWQPFYKKELE